MTSAYADLGSAHQNGRGTQTAAALQQQLPPPASASLPSRPALRLYKVIQYFAGLEHKVTKVITGYCRCYYKTLAMRFVRYSKRPDRPVAVEYIRRLVRELERLGWVERQFEQDGEQCALIRPIVGGKLPTSADRVPTAPPAAWQKPVRTWPEMSPAPAAEPIQENPAEASADGVDSGEKSSGVCSGVSAPVPLINAPFGGSVSDHVDGLGQQQAGGRRNAVRNSREPYAFSPDQAAVVADLTACGVFGQEARRLARALPLRVLRLAIGIARWRKERGEIEGDGAGGFGGYVRRLAIGLHSLGWKPPRRYLVEASAAADGTAAPATLQRRSTLPIGTHVDDRRAAGETQRAKLLEKSAGGKWRPNGADLALIERLAKHAVGWQGEHDARGERAWRDAANRIVQTEEYLWFPVDWTAS